ncbi:hypothetical protein, partial [Escherichia coli]|uniref:hypothetical protein n=1 Tax=Escherichia coli TaxID=562 RepID=UPI00215A6BCB
MAFRRGVGGGGSGRQAGGRAGRCARESQLQVGLGEPEVALRLGGGSHGLAGAARLGQQLPHADEHADGAQ